MKELIHGQVACLDKFTVSGLYFRWQMKGVAKDKLRATSLKLAAPAEVKFVVKQ